MSADMSDIVK